MTVSKAFWKITLKNIGTVITYTFILVLFGAVFRESNSTTTPQYEASKPEIVIFNHDENVGITKGLVDYLDKNAEIKTDYEDDDRLKDALFYEQVVLAIDIPDNYHQDFALGHNPELKMRSSAGYRAELAKVIVKRYLSVAKSYAALNLSEQELVRSVADALKTETKVEVQSTVDATHYAKAASYFNFANYSILACVITVICLIISSFNRREIRRRNLVSSVELSKMNIVLLRNCCLYSLAVWAFYMVLAIILNGADIIFSGYGLLFTINSFIFNAFATALAYLLSTLVRSQGAVNGIMNVVALGSSFLCGAFVPAEYLPDAVLAFAHILPSYYYIDGNNRIMNIEQFDAATIWPIVINMLVVFGAAVVLAVISIIVSKIRQKE